MDLHSYFNKNVKIISISDNIFIGKVISYTSAKDNEENEESIVIDTSSRNIAIELMKSEIKSIEIIN